MTDSVGNNVVVLYPDKPIEEMAKVPQSFLNRRALEALNERVREAFATETALGVGEEVLFELQMAGVKTEDATMEDKVLVIESIKSLIMRTQGKVHVLQDVADYVVNIPEDYDLEVVLDEYPIEDEDEEDDEDPAS